MRHRGRPGRRVLAAGAVGLALIAVAVIAIASSGGSPSAAAGPSISTATTRVTRQDLVDTDSEDGTLGYGDSRSVVNHLSGTVTWLPGTGALVRSNHRLYAVDGKPVILMDGRVPAYRQLDSSSSDGRDIRQLERDLRAEGYDTGHAMTVDGSWDSGTTAAVERWQKHHGLSQTGEIKLGRIVFQPGARRIESVGATLGGSAATANAGSGSSSASGSSASGSSTGASSGASSSGSTGSSSSTASSLVSGEHTEYAAFVVTTKTTPTTTPTTTTPTTTTPTTTTPTTTTPTTTTPTTTTPTTTTPGKSPGRPNKTKSKSKPKSSTGSKGGRSTPTGSAPAGGAGGAAPSGGGGASGGASSGGAGTGTSAAGGASSGGSVANAILTTTSERRVVTVALATTKFSLARIGARVGVSLPSGGRVTGHIIDVSKVATTSSSGSGGSSSATVTVTIRLTGRGSALDKAPVTVSFEQSRVRNVLAIPVTALLARPGGTFAVEAVEGAGRRLIRVTPGLYTSGYVQISGRGLRAGLRVTNAAIR